MSTEPSRASGHKEFICSTSIERVVSGRDSTQPQTEKLLQHLDVVFQPTSAIGEGTGLALKFGQRF